MFLSYETVARYSNPTSMFVTVISELLQMFFLPRATLFKPQTEDEDHRICWFYHVAGVDQADSNRLSHKGLSNLCSHKQQLRLSVQKRSNYTVLSKTLRQ